jgi:isopentenyl diphosphate isomerase/L-lactate dehydrogenase-like FMN-dependent dehydrogenase
MIDAAIPDQTQFLQLYVNSDREKTKKIIQHAEKRGVKALFITVDAPQLGRRPKVDIIRQVIAHHALTQYPTTGHANEV